MERPPLRTLRRVGCRVVVRQLVCEQQHGRPRLVDMLRSGPGRTV